MKAPRQHFILTAVLGAAVIVASPAGAQDAAPPEIPQEIQQEVLKELENDPEYQETQKFLDDAQSQVAKVRAETDARAKEIEALAVRVGEIISNIGATSEDNTNLRSEISVLTDLLKLERQTTGELREDLKKLNTRFDDARLERLKSDQRKDRQIEELRRENTKALKRLNEAVETIADQAKTNQVLASDLEDAKKEMERQDKEIELLKKNRYRPRRRTTR
jgi:chromosome segregation ATPase